MSGKIDLPQLRLAVCRALRSPSGLTEGLELGAFGWRVLSLEGVSEALRAYAGENWATGNNWWARGLNRRTLAPKHVKGAVESLLTLGLLREEFQAGEVLYSLTELARPLFLDRQDFTIKRTLANGSTSTFFDKVGWDQAQEEQVSLKVLLGYSPYDAKHRASPRPYVPQAAYIPPESVSPKRDPAEDIRDANIRDYIRDAVERMMPQLPCPKCGRFLLCRMSLSLDLTSVIACQNPGCWGRFTVKHINE